MGGAYRCERHGTHGLDQMCAHVRNAFRGERGVPRYARYELGFDDDPFDAWVSWWLCRECAHAFGLPLAPPPRPFGVPDPLATKLSEMAAHAECSECSAGWFVAHAVDGMPRHLHWGD